MLECGLRHRDGSVRHFEILYTDLLDDENVNGIVLNGRDVSERRVFEEQLAHQAFHDLRTSSVLDQKSGPTSQHSSR